MKSSRLIVALGCAVAGSMFGATQAKAAPTLIESWEGTLDGWQVPSPAGTQTTYVPGFSTTTGVTDGASSLSIGSPTNSPNYGQMLLGPGSVGLTSILGHASSLSLDVYTPPGSFGFFLQFDFDVNNADTGFVSLDSFSYPGTTIGAQSTITVPISPSLAATLAASSNSTGLIIQIGGGFSAGNETMYLDNLRANPAAVPEASSSMAGLGAASLLGLARRRNR